MNAPQQAITKRDLTGPQGLEVLQDRGGLRGDIATSDRRGGLRFVDAFQMMEMAKMMAASHTGVPEHLRGNPGGCLRIVIQADEWGFSPFAVADQSYLVKDRMAYMSAIIHAVIERHAPLEGRLRAEWTGDGATRRCRVIGRLIGESEPFIWEGPEIGKITTKNSPEWAANPDKQLWYHASRDWCRIYCPDVLLGVYSRDELDGNYGPDRAKEVGESVASRLPGVTEGKQGFDAQGIALTLGGGQDASEQAQEGQDGSDGTRVAPEGETAATGKRKRKRGPNKPRSTLEPQEGEGNPVAELGEREQNDAHAPEQSEPEPAGATPPADPTTAEQYTAFAENWIAKVSRDDADARWEGEQGLRDTCKVSAKERTRLRHLLTDRFAA